MRRVDWVMATTTSSFGVADVCVYESIYEYVFLYIKSIKYKYGLSNNNHRQCACISYRQIETIRYIKEGWVGKTQSTTKWKRWCMLMYIYIYTFIYIPLNIHVGWVENRIENGQAPTHSRGLGYNLSRAIEIYGSDNDQSKCHDKTVAQYSHVVVYTK